MTSVLEEINAEIVGNRMELKKAKQAGNDSMARTIYEYLSELRTFSL
jgi:hypothetical protein